MRKDLNQIQRELTEDDLESVTSLAESGYGRDLEIELGGIENLSRGSQSKLYFSRPNSLCAKRMIAGRTPEELEQEIREKCRRRGMSQKEIEEWIRCFF